MKNIYLFLTGLLLLLCFTVNANNTNDRISNQTPFIFLESGIEYAVFNNGEFDFNIIQRPTANVNINTRNVNLSFNTGRNYEPYIQQNRYGAIIQIERTPIFYDRYGKVSRIGSININYNYQGLVSNIGNLNIYYNNYGTIYNRRGYINRQNINYRPRYQSYKRSTSRKPIAYHKPYKQNNTVKRQYKSKNYNSNNKYSNKNSSANNKNQQSNYKNYNSSSTKNREQKSSNKKVQKQESNKKESYRENSNSYRRTSKNTESQYASSDNSTYKKR